MGIDLLFLFCIFEYFAERKEEVPFAIFSVQPDFGLHFVYILIHIVFLSFVFINFFKF